MTRSVPVTASSVCTTITLASTRPADTRACRVKIADGGPVTSSVYLKMTSVYTKMSVGDELDVCNVICGNFFLFGESPLDTLTVRLLMQWHAIVYNESSIKT